ncbi:DUF4123 domain-containing protein [Pseudomonas sp. FME51]|uniref:DUF4123 domain-containing protein n=1 Tax=Pseudomonas sp. FME51 TaxID=2742609 RepID=UPI0018673E06|nr:DUF4123 domain-containing protein [Pseudomonas sp. FME51]
MTGQMQWLLLDFRDDLLKRLYQQDGELDLYRLFDNTELASYSAQSPVLVNIECSPGLLMAFHEEPKHWPGLLLQTSQCSAELLQHLRHILIVNFEGERKGVLRYYNPRTASYFFVGQRTGLATWLGPIEKLSWYGGTWRDEAEETTGLHTTTNPVADTWQPSTTQEPLRLTHEQEQALQCQQAENFLYQWWLGQQPPVPSSQAWIWLEEGQQLDLHSTNALTDYLDIRRRYPHHPLPTGRSEASDIEKITYLRAHFQRHNDKERFS